MIYVALNFSGNHIKNKDEFKEKIGHIMDFWIDDITFFTWIKWQSGFKKNPIVVLK